MNRKMEIVKQIKNGIAILEREGNDEFDIVTAVFSILHETTNLMGTICDKEKIKVWKDLDDPSFYRFASKLKLGLELQRDYLNTISDQLILEGDIVSQKIAVCHEQINSLLEQERTILKEVSPLIEKENELREARRRVDMLLSKKNELEGIEKKLSGIDIKALKRQVAEKEKIRDDLENRYKPLLEKKETLQNSLTDLNEAINSISEELTRLETAYGEEARRLTENIPQWIEKIKNRQIIREEKDKEYIARLEKEAERLRETEKKLQEHLNKSNEFVSLAMTNWEIMRRHFEANKTIGSRFSKSLTDIQDNLSGITDAVEKELTNFDESLRVMQKRIQEIASEFKPIGIGG